MIGSVFTDLNCVPHGYSTAVLLLQQYAQLPTVPIRKIMRQMHCA